MEQFLQAGVCRLIYLLRLNEFNLLTRLVVTLGLFELFDVGWRQLRPVDLQGQFVKLASEREWWLVVRVVYAGQRVGANVEALVPLQNDG